MKPQRLTAIGTYCWHTVRLAGYLAISISLWQAPVPWVHRHDSAVATTRVDSVDHQRMFHDGPSAGSECEWHAHIAFLDDIAQSGGMPVNPAGQPGHPSNQVFFSAKLCPQPAGELEVVARPLVRQAESSLLGEVKACSLSKQPFHPSWAARRLLTLLCVARC